MGGRIIASAHARNAKAAGLDIITWTLERSGVLPDGNNGFYYQTFDNAIRRERDAQVTPSTRRGRESGPFLISQWGDTRGRKRRRRL